MANSRLSGGLEVKGLSLSWGGPLELRGISVTDPEKREVLIVQKISCGRGVWGLLRSWETFGDITIDGPEAVLYINDKNEISLVRAFEMRDPSPPSADPANLPQLVGKAVIRSGRVRAVRENGPSYEIPAVNGEVDLASLGKKLAATLKIKLPDGAEIAGDADVLDLAPHGRLQLADASATLNIQTSGDIDLAPLSALFAPQAGLTGTLTINGRLNADPKSLNADVLADVKKLQTTSRASEHAVPIDMSVKGTAGRTGDIVDAKADLRGDVGHTTVDVSFNCKSAFPDLTAEKLLSAIFDGTALGLPDFRANAQGAVDLVKLQKAVPGILVMRPGQELTSGKFEISKVAIRGGEAPTANGSIAIRELAATGGEKSIRLEPIAVDFGLSLVPGKGLEIARGDLKSCFAAVATKGTASSLQADIRANLSKMQQELGQIFDLSSVNLTGDLAGNIKVARTGDLIDANADLKGDIGEATVDASFNYKTAFPELTAETLLSAILDGGPLGLPEFRADAQGAVDLVKLQMTVPGILAMRAGQELTSGKIEISKLAVRGGNAPTANGSVAVRELAATGGGKPVRLEPIAIDFDVSLTQGKGLQIAKGDLKSNFAELATKGTPSDVEAVFSANLSKMQEELGQIFDLSGVNLSGNLAGDVNVSRKGDVVDAKASLNGDVGQATVDASFNYKSPFPELTAEKMLSAMLEGTPLGLPEFRGDAQGSIDLVKLQKFLPRILVVRPGQQLTGGRIEITKLSVRGGDAPTANGSVAVRELAATGGGPPVRLEPITIDFDVTLPAGKGLEIARGDLKSSFAELATKGAAADLQAVFRANLSMMQQELGQIFDLSGVALAGNVAGDVKIARAGEDRVDVTVKTQGDGLRVGSGGRVFEVQKLNLSQVGFVSLQNKSVRRYDASELQVDMDGQVAASAKGWIDFKEETFKANADIKQADLSFASKRAGALGVRELSRYSGVLTGRATAERTSPGDTIATEGAFTGRNLGVDGKPVVDGDANLTWEGVKIASDGSDVTADLVKLASSAANVDAKGLRFQTGPSTNVSGDVVGSADFQRLFRAIAPLTNMTKPPDIAGRLGVNAKLATVNNVVTVSGNGGVDQFQVGSGKQVVREKRVDFEFDSRIDQPADRIELKRCTVTSTPLTAEVNGTIDQYSKSAVLGLRGRYDASWDQLMAILHELTPATAKTVIVKGRSASTFEISGPMSQPGAKPEFRGVKSGADVTWASAELYGVKMGAAKLSPVLRDGRMTLPTATIPASGGRVNVSGIVDFQPMEPELSIPGRLPLMENVEITKEMGAELLSRINPIFMYMTRVEGHVSMLVQDVRAPLGAAIKHSGTGKGVLDLGKLKIQPGGIFADLFGFVGLPVDKLYPVEVGKVDFVLKNGRIHYDNFYLVLPPGYDIKFYGSVGFDDTVDLVISLPVTPNLIRSFKLPLTDTLMPALSAVRIDIPMAGTRQNPKLDFAKVDTKKLLEALLKPKIDPTKPIDDLLKGKLFGEKPKEGAAPPADGGSAPPKSSPPPPPADKPKKKPLLPPPKKKK